MNEIPAEVQEFVKMLQSKGAEVRVVQGTKTALKELVNELVEMKEEQEQEQDSIQDLPFELALMAVKTNRNVKRKNWTDKVLVDVNDFVYMQDTVGGNLVKYEATFEDINAKDWIAYD
mgnify:CR=1 FL=1